MNEQNRSLTYTRTHTHTHITQDQTPHMHQVCNCHFFSRFSVLGALAAPSPGQKQHIPFHHSHHYSQYHVTKPTCTQRIISRARAHTHTHTRRRGAVCVRYTSHWRAHMSPLPKTTKSAGLRKKKLGPFLCFGSEKRNHPFPLTRMHTHTWAISHTYAHETISNSLRRHATHSTEKRPQKILDHLPAIKNHDQTQFFFWFSPPSPPSCTSRRYVVTQDF